ncbi:MAG TPA: GNVR domain-containing protein [Vicinamibacterales bacterium]|nr:GNVR domain-containing protein [Vicinamibacterales bacterium]
MLPGHKYTPDEIFRILTRRRWLVLLPFAAGLAAVPTIARLVPELYRSETLIMVVPQRVPDSYVKSTITEKVEDRLPSISDQILSRSRLERIILDFDLYAHERATGIMEDVVQRMRSDIDVKLEGKESFRVSYVSHEPKTARQVTERLASLYIEENLRDRENLADSTNLFLESQLQDAKRRLIEHEKKLEEYRRRYAGQLPSQLASNLQVIQNTQLQLQAVSETMNRARERRLLVERQIADAQTLPVPVIPVSGAMSTGEGPVPLTAAQQLESARARLEVLKLRYTPDHPDIRALERAIVDMQAKAEAEAKQPPDVLAKKTLSPEEAARQKRIADLQAELAVIDHQIAASQADDGRLKKALADYQAKIDVVPTRESELVELTRDYTTLQETYSSLLAKQEDSKLAANLERRQVGEQFKILDPASLPERPHNLRQRVAIILSGALAGLVLGLGLVAFFEYRNLSFSREADVVRLLSLPVLALIPAMTSERERRQRQRRGRLFDAAATLVLVGSVAIVIAWRLRS